MSDILWAVVAIGGPILIASAAIYGLLMHNQPPRRDPLSDEGTMARIVRSDQPTDQGL